MYSIKVTYLDVIKKHTCFLSVILYRRKGMVFLEPHRNHPYNFFSLYLITADLNNILQA